MMFKPAVLKRIIICSLFLLPVLLAAPVEVCAQAPNEGYNYNYFKEPVASPNGYLAEKVLYGEDTGAGAFNAPKDIYVTGDNKIFLLDSGNNRIVVLDDMFRVEKIISSIQTQNGSEALNAPEGIFVDDQGTIYVADTGNGRVLAMDNGGIVKSVFVKPESELIRKDLEYKPQKVLVDRLGSIYVLAYGMIEGILDIDEDGNFKGFYGSNQVQLSFQEIIEQTWKRFFTKEQKAQMTSFVPIEYSNLDLDNENFIYAVTRKSLNYTDQIKKLNPQGTNILSKNVNSFSNSSYGDLEEQNLLETAFVDICVDDDGFFYGLDINRGRFYMYDQESNLLFVGGGLGDQAGTFRKPSAIDVINDKLLILDSEKNSITVFYATPFGKTVREAVKLYNDGMFREAVTYWEEVLKRDTNYEMAYKGIGKAQLMTNEFREAMHNFKLGRNSKGYDEAFTEYRKQILSKNFLGVLLTAIAIFLLISVYSRRSKISGYFHRKGWFSR